jgi:hypothetical protein
MLLGCAKRIDFGPTGEVRDARELLKLTDQAERQILSVKGGARLRVGSPKASGTLNVFAAVRDPDKLHIESLNFFGKPQGILFTTGGHFGLLDADAGKYYRGPASQENLSRFIPVALPVPELVAIMLGRAPRIAFSAASLKVDTARRSYVVALEGNGLQQTLWVDPASHRVRRSEVRGPKPYDLSFDDFQGFASTEYPRQTTLVVPSEATRLELKYRDLELNPRLDGSLFELAPPSGMTVVEVDEAGNPRALAPGKPAAPLSHLGAPTRAGVGGL